MSEASPPKQPYLGSWRWRRLVIFAALIYCGWLVAYIVTHLGDKLDAGAIATAILAVLALVGAIIGSYCFAAVWDDHSIRKSLGGQ